MLHRCVLCGEIEGEALGNDEVSHEVCLSCTEKLLEEVREGDRNELCLTGETTSGL